MVVILYSRSLKPTFAWLSFVTAFDHHYTLPSHPRTLAVSCPLIASLGSVFKDFSHEGSLVIFIFLSLSYFLQDSVLWSPIRVSTKDRISLVKAKQYSIVHFV